MRKYSLLDRYLLLKPSVRAWIESLIIIIFGVLGITLNSFKMPFFPVINIIGGVLLIVSGIFHGYCEKTHKQAHDQANDIKKIITTGMYSKIRHPIYLSLIIMNLGIALAFGIYWSLFFAIIFSIFSVLIALKEEEFLLDKFKNEYEEYIRKVPYRMIPGIF